MPELGHLHDIVSMVVKLCGGPWTSDNISGLSRSASATVQLIWMIASSKLYSGKVMVSPAAGLVTPKTLSRFAGRVSVVEVAMGKLTEQKR